MDEINVDDKNICFSSARKMFENSSNKPKQIISKKKDFAMNNKDLNSDKNSSTVVSMATLKKQGRHIKKDDNKNSSDDGLVDKKTEISILKANINMKLQEQQNNELSKVKTVDEENCSNHAILNEQNLNVKKQEPKKIVRFVDITSSKEFLKLPSNDKNVSKIPPSHGNARQSLLNEIKAGRTLKHISKQTENKVHNISEVAFEPWIISESINKTDQPPKENRFISKVSNKRLAPTSKNQDLTRTSESLNKSVVKNQNDGQINSTVLNIFQTDDIPKWSSISSNVTHPIIDLEEAEDDKVAKRTFLSDWDPTKLVKELYTTEVRAKSSIRYQYLDKSGYLECLPTSKTKETFLKTWKRKFLKAHGGKISFYEGSKEENESGRMEMSGGKVDIIGPRMLAVEDGGGRYLVVRCLDEVETKSWKESIESQIAGDVSVKWIQPSPPSDFLEHKLTVVIEIGSCSVRAGILNSFPTLPNIFFPNIVATNPSGTKVFGFDALKPKIRSSSILSFPVKPSNKVDKYALEWESITGLFSHVFQQLQLEPSQCSVMFIAPTNFNHHVRCKFMDIFFETLKIKSASMFSQTLLALYSYKVDTGIIVNAGETIEILAVVDGFVVEGSVLRVPFGGQRVSEMFNSFLAGRKYRFSMDAEFHLIRYAVEKLCYVSLDFKNDLDKCLTNSEAYRKVLPLDSFDLPFEAAEPINCDLGCFRSAEGFFDMSAWGVDSPSLQQLIQKVISNCPIDSRRQMWRNIYLSGGITLLPNFKERLEAELSKLTTVVVQVHASPHRYHAPYLGACALANMKAFQRYCVTIDEWGLSAGECLKKMIAF